MNGEVLIDKMVKEIKAGVNVEEVVDRYCACATPGLRQQLIDGIRQIVGKDMIERAMSK